MLVVKDKDIEFLTELANRLPNGHADAVRLKMITSDAWKREHGRLSDFVNGDVKIVMERTHFDAGVRVVPRYHIIGVDLFFETSLGAFRHNRKQGAMAELQQAMDSCNISSDMTDDDARSIVEKLASFWGVAL